MHTRTAAIGVAGALYSLCAANVLAHGEAEWIQRNPRYVDEAGHHCCSSECKRWDEQAFREEGDEIIFLPTEQRFKRNWRGTYRSENVHWWVCVPGGLLGGPDLPSASCIFYPFHSQ
jgi:hypothetical protein